LSTTPIPSWLRGAHVSRKHALARYGDRHGLPTDVLVVDSTDDLRAHDEGDHYALPADTTVWIGGTVDLGAHYLQLAEGTVLRGHGHSTIVSLATGGVVRATALEAAVILREVNVVAPLGPCLNLSGPIDQQLNLFFVGLIGAVAGMINGFDVQALKDCYIRCDDGLHLGGVTNKVYVSACPFYGITAGNAGITLAATLDAEVVDVQSSFFKSEAGTAMRAVAGYQVGEGVVVDSIVLGATVPFEGMGPEDVQWTFRGNTGARDSMTVGESHSTASLLVDIVTQDVPVRAANPSMSGANTERFTNDGTSGLTYTGIRPATVLATATIQVDPAGNNVSGWVYLARDGVPITESRIPFGVTAGQDIRTVTISDLIRVTTGETVSVWVANASGVVDITVPIVSLIAKA